jgi:hypothetical protein
MANPFPNKSRALHVIGLKYKSVYPRGKPKE